jgi:hypothetical protein
MEEEIFKVCIETYEVSNFGNIRKKMKSGCYTQIKCSIQNRGYKYFQLQREGKRKNYLIHHLVAEYFIGIRPIGLEIDHIDRNKLNNNVNNLRYVSHGENMCNIANYKTHITETDKEKRKKLIIKEWRKNNKEYIKEFKHQKYIENTKNMNIKRIGKYKQNSGNV